MARQQTRFNYNPSRRRRRCLSLAVGAAKPRLILFKGEEWTRLAHRLLKLSNLVRKFYV